MKSEYSKRSGGLGILAILGYLIVGYLISLIGNQVVVSILANFAILPLMPFIVYIRAVNTTFHRLISDKNEQDNNIEVE